VQLKQLHALCDATSGVDVHFQLKYSSPMSTVLLLLPSTWTFFLNDPYDVALFHWIERVNFMWAGADIKLGILPVLDLPSQKHNTGITQ